MGERERYAIEMQRLKLREQRYRLRTWAMRILILLIVALICFCIFGISIVQGDSMRPAYQDGDAVFFTRILPKDVTYGDVVIIEDPEGKEIIKRIAGLPGDTITVYDNGRLVRNQIAVQEQDIIYSAAPGSTWQTITIPENSYFYLGDNRPISKDSRQNGCADKAQIKGKAIASLRR